MYLAVMDWLQAGIDTRLNPGGNGNTPGGFYYRYFLWYQQSAVQDAVMAICRKQLIQVVLKIISPMHLYVQEAVHIGSGNLLITHWS